MAGFLFVQSRIRVGFGIRQRGFQPDHSQPHTLTRPICRRQMALMRLIGHSDLCHLNPAEQEPDRLAQLGESQPNLT